MEQKENKVNKAIIENKLNRYGATKKTMYSVIGMFVCILLIIVLSITQATFDTNLLTTAAFWIDFAILTGLSIYGMISGQQTGDDMARNNPSGAFRKTLKKFLDLFNKIDSLMLFAYFNDWIEWYRERKLRKKIESTLKDAGIHQMEVLSLDIREIDKLTSPFKKEWQNGEKDTYFLSYTQEQIDLIKYCMTGNIKVSKLPSSFFLDALNQSEKDMWESAANSGKKKSLYITTSYLYRIFALLAMAVISAGLVPGKSEDINKAAVWISLATRIFCVIASFGWGIFIGHEIVKIDISYVEFKIDVLNQYYQENELGIYKHETIEEKAKKAYDEFVDKQKERDDVDGGEENIVGEEDILD